MGALTAPILGLCLLAAFAHAGWNLLAKGAHGGQGFVWLVLAEGDGARRAVASAAILAGIVALALG